MKKIIIIGASSGLGAAIATDFAVAGWKVGVAARREAPLKALQQQFPDNVVYRTIDVTAQDAVVRFNELVSLANGLDTLLFVSGVGFYDPQLDDDKVDGTLQVNTVGFARLTAAAYRYFRSKAPVGRGQIAAITSVAGVKGIGVSAAYSASKRFQQTFLDALEQLARQQGVAVDITDIRPGFVRTPLLDSGREYPMIMSVGYAARLIERAVVRRRRVAVIDSRWAVVSALWRILPRYVWNRMAINF